MHDVARDTIATLARTGPLSQVCQILDFLNRTSIGRDTANFVKPCFVFKVQSNNKPNKINVVFPLILPTLILIDLGYMPIASIL